MVEVLRSDPFVPNSVSMGNREPRSKVLFSWAIPCARRAYVSLGELVITGPNMEEIFLGSDDCTHLPYG